VSLNWKSRRPIAITRIENATLYLEFNIMKRTTGITHTGLREKDGAIQWQRNVGSLSLIRRRARKMIFRYQRFQSARDKTYSDIQQLKGRFQLESFMVMNN
jgi:hypothetical protein